MTDWKKLVGEHMSAHPFFLQGVGLERKRIIELLETINAEPDGVTWDMAIALIKGENK